MYFYDYKGAVTNQYDYNALQVVGSINVYLDEEKTQHLTDLMFPTFPFAEIPGEQRTKEGFQEFVDTKVMELVNSPEVQAKLDEVRFAYEMGLIELM